jgi:predicted DNA-binding transcriptional regulator AlpA
MQTDLPADSILTALATRQFLGGISPSTLWRWERNAPGFPQPIKIHRRKFYRVGDLRSFIDAMSEAA